MSAVNLTIRALQSGTSLAHNHNQMMPVDALTALGWCKDPLGVILLKLRLGNVTPGIASDKGPLLQWLVWECGRKRWVFRDAEQLRNFGLQCLSEWLGERCPTCNGRDHRITMNGVVTECDECGGTGRMRDSQRIRAKAMGISHTTVRRVWGENFDHIIGELSIIERRTWRGEKLLFEEY